MIDILHVAPNKPGHVIDAVWVVVSRDANGEGMCAGPMPPLPVVPYIAADEARLESVVAMAADLARITGQTFTLIKLSRRDVVGTIDGGGLTRHAESDGKASEWTCGHVAGSMCAECYRLLAERANQLAREHMELLERGG